MDGGYTYDVQLDRFDVAVRAAAKLAMDPRRRKLAPWSGLRAEHQPLVQTALLEIDNWRTEKGVFDLIEKCPFLLPAALELLRAYDTTYAVARSYHYRRKRA